MLFSRTAAACILGLGVLSAGVLTSSAASAQDVRITTFKTQSTFTLNGTTFTVTRNQDTNALLEGEFRRTARACPPECLQPITAAPGVETFAELEVLTFLETTVSNGNGLLIDIRPPQQFSASAIPGAVNVPGTTLTAENQFRPDILRALGAVDQADGSMTYSGAMTLTIYGGGPWSAAATTVIADLLEAGYPANKLNYYRGGLQAWTHAGLSTVPSSNPG